MIITDIAVVMLILLLIVALIIAAFKLFEMTKDEIKKPGYKLTDVDVLIPLFGGIAFLLLSITIIGFIIGSIFGF